ncbi:MAG: MltA domain-containing protein [Ferrovum myxofaciens]|nr:murein transglycosylase A [Ferrovum myxofaciens]
MRMTRLLISACILVPFLLAGCATPPPAPQSAASAPRPGVCAPVSPTCPQPVKTVSTPAENLALPPPGHLVRTDFSQLPHWDSGLSPATWNAFLESCTRLSQDAPWTSLCQQATALGPFDALTMRRFFEHSFDPWQILNPDESPQGLITGYYEPLLQGSLTRTAVYRFPLYGPPPDLLTIDLGDLAPDLKGRHLRGRLVGNRVVPYFSRAEIDLEDGPLTGHELLWVDNPVKLFFLQIQGSGVVQLRDGRRLHVGYADQNGHPFRSIARYLMEQGQLSLAQASMQGIEAWARSHPQDLQAVLNQNPSFVFFRLLPPDLPGPLGTLGVPLTGQASLAVDTQVIPLGAPVFLSTTWPGRNQPLDRLMMAQDTGGAIRGAVRADFFWGFGVEAEEAAGHMKQAGQLWLLYPHGVQPPAAH